MKISGQACQIVSVGFGSGPLIGQASFLQLKQRKEVKEYQKPSGCNNLCHLCRIYALRWQDYFSNQLREKQMKTNRIPPTTPAQPLPTCPGHPMLSLATRLPLRPLSAPNPQIQGTRRLSRTLLDCIQRCHTTAVLGAGCHSYTLHRRGFAVPTQCPVSCLILSYGAALPVLLPVST